MHLVMKTEHRLSLHLYMWSTLQIQDKHISAQLNLYLILTSPHFISLNSLLDSTPPLQNNIRSQHIWATRNNSPMLPVNLLSRISDSGFSLFQPDSRPCQFHIVRFTSVENPGKMSPHSITDLPHGKYYDVRRLSQYHQLILQNG